jgi:hypothetical protein
MCGFMSDWATETDWRLLLSGAERARMLQDIAQVGLAVGRHLFTDASRDDLDIAAGSLLSRKSPIERLGFIARTLPALTQAVEQIVNSPLTTTLPHSRRVTPPERARRLDTQALLHSFQKGESSRSAVEIGTAISWETPENRAARAFLEVLRRDAAAIAPMAEAAGELEMAETARHCTTRLRGLSSRLDWDENRTDPVDMSMWVAPPTHRMLAHPAYARLAGWIRRYRQDFGFDWATPLFQLPARETWRLYEAWGLFQTLNVLLALGYTPQAGMPDTAGTAMFAVKNDRLMFRLAKGEASLVGLRSSQGREIRLFYNRSYPARRRSLSRTMQPDIVLEDDEGQTWILDPKFKSYAIPGEEGDDIDQMHAYRDAIVDVRGVKPVQCAWCLFVGRSDTATRPLIAYGPPAASVVGALRLRPGDTESFTQFCNLLASWGFA